MATKSQMKKAAAAKPSKKTRVRGEPEEKPKKEKITLGPDASIDDIISSINHNLGSNVIRRAEEMSTMYILRRPTGITTLDIDLAGGFPASATTVFVGPDGAGKDYLIWKDCAEVQKIYGDDFCMAAFFTEFKADKPFMRNMCGLEIAMSDEEIVEYNAAREKIGRPPLTDEEVEEYQTQTGRIFIIDGVTAEKGFDAVIDLVATNKCQIVVINSIGSLQTEAKEAVDSFEEFPRQANEATLINMFIPKLAMVLNNDRNGRNETSLFIVNQMRSKRDAAPVRGRPVSERDKYEPGSKSWALKHGKAIELSLHKGPKHVDAFDGTTAGRVIRWSIDKGKLGTHDGLQGEYNFFYDGGVDVIDDLIVAAKKYGVFEGTSWITYEHDELGFKVQGNDGLRRKLLENPDLYEHVRLECFKKAGVIYRWR